MKPIPQNAPVQLDLSWNNNAPPQAMQPAAAETVLVAIEGPLQSEMEARVAQGVTPIIV